MSIVLDNQNGGFLTRLFGNALEGFVGAARHVRRRIEINRNRRTLHGLPDHILKDIGLARGDINHVTNSLEVGADRRWNTIERLYGANRGRGL